MVEIRAYQPDTDTPGVLACIVELQDYERALEPRLLAGAAIAEQHLANLLDHCREYGGGVLVALDGTDLVGFVCVWTRVPPDGLDAVPLDHAYISDLAVLASHRGRGIGRALIDRAEARAREDGAGELRIGVFARNAGARRLYAAAGFTDERIELVKPLTAAGARERTP